MDTENIKTHDRLLRRPIVESMTALSRSGIYEKLNPRSPNYDADFPVPVRLGARAVAWRESEVVTWMNGLARAQASA